MASDIGGVWRTIGGRRVFIKDGQDLASAMKESGKFKPSKKQTEEAKRLNEKAKKSAKEDIEKYLKGNNENWDNDEEFLKELSDEYALDRNEVKKMFNYQKYVHDTLNNEDYIRENMPAGARFSKMIEESGIKTFADEIKEQSSKTKILSEKQLSNMSWEEVVQENTKYYSAKSIYDFEGGKQGKYKYEDGWRDNGGAGVIKQSDIDKLITKEEWLKARKKK